MIGLPQRWRRPALWLAGGALAGGLSTWAAGDRIGRLGERMASKVDRTWDRLFGERQPPEAEWQAPGWELLPHADGFDFPVRIVLHPRPPTAQDDPFYFVAELPGSIEMVTLDGTRHTVVEGLLDFEWKPVDELGLMGLEIDPSGERLYATLTYWDDDEGVYRNKVEVLELEDEPPRVTRRTVLLDMKDEPTVASYCVQFVSLGPDGRLYVGVGAGGNKTDAQDLDKFAGKILRMTPGGEALADNPFYDPQAPSSPRSYVWAYGLRNPFDITWDPRTKVGLVAEVGPGIDRLFRLERGVNYCFGDGEGESRMRANALYTWGPGGHFAPTGIAFAPASLFGEGEGAYLYLGLFGPVYMPGPNDGKQILRFAFDDRGWLASGPKVIARYGGKYFSSVTDVVAAHDAVYFADLYGPGDPPHGGKGIVYRMVRTADADNPEVLGDGLEGAERGEQLFASVGCGACHDLDEASSGKEGPPLGGLAARLEKRLGSEAYERELRAYASREGGFFRRNRPAYQALLDSAPDARPRIWFRHHLRDPRFDHPKSKMPAYAHLPPEDIEALADFLLGAP